MMPKVMQIWDKDFCGRKKKNYKKKKAINIPHNQNHSTWGEKDRERESSNPFYLK